jgi:hypothetical protein
LKQYVRIEKKDGTCLKGSTNGEIRVYIADGHVVAEAAKLGACINDGNRTYERLSAKQKDVKSISLGERGPEGPQEIWTFVATAGS